MNDKSQPTRDFIGYAGQPPTVVWPDEARIAVNFCINYEEGETQPKMMTIGLHARLIGRPGRIASLHKFLDYVRGHDRVWICRRDDLASYWLENYPNREA